MWVVNLVGTQGNSECSSAQKGCKPVPSKTFTDINLAENGILSNTSEEFGGSRSQQIRPTWQRTISESSQTGGQEETQQLIPISQLQKTNELIRTLLNILVIIAVGGIVFTSFPVITVLAKLCYVTTVIGANDATEINYIVTNNSKLTQKNEETKNKEKTVTPCTNLTVRSSREFQQKMALLSNLKQVCLQVRLTSRSDWSTKPMPKSSQVTQLIIRGEIDRGFSTVTKVLALFPMIQNLTLIHASHPKPYSGNHTYIHTNKMPKKQTLSHITSLSFQQFPVATDTYDQFAKQLLTPSITNIEFRNCIINDYSKAGLHILLKNTRFSTTNLKFLNTLWLTQPFKNFGNVLTKVKTVTFDSSFKNDDEVEIFGGNIHKYLPNLETFISTNPLPYKYISDIFQLSTLKLLSISLQMHAGEKLNLNQFVLAFPSLVRATLFLNISNKEDCLVYESGVTQNLPNFIIHANCVVTYMKPNKR